MPTRRSSSSTSTASRASPSSSGGPHFIAPSRVAIPAYPSFKDRLSATDTWTKATSAPAGGPTPALRPLPRACSPSSSRTTSTFLTPSLSPAPRAHSSRSSSTPRTHPYQRARSTSSSATTSSGASTSTARSTASQVQAAQAAAVRAALQQGQLDANSYTDGQLYAIREGAAQAFVRGEAKARGVGGGRGEVEGQARVEGGKKRKRRGAGIEGREGGVVKAVKVRRSSCAVEGEVEGSEDDEGEERVEVEVDLRRMLGL